MADTMMRFNNNELATSFLSKAELKEKCSMAFKTAPTNPNLSTKYVQANTLTVVDDLEKLGWYPVDAKQCKRKANSSGIHSFHMIAFQNPNIKITKTLDDGEEIVDTYPRIILTNSQEGFNSFKFMVGLFRLVCSNGLVVCDNEMVNMSIRHINYTFEELRTIVAQAVDEIPNIVNTMNEMRLVELNEEQKIELATEVVKIRSGLNDVDIDVDEDTIKNILTPIREEDYSNDLWTIFNLCQEKMIKGGYSAKNAKNKMRKQRGIKSIKKDIDYNQRLWETASKYLMVA